MATDSRVLTSSPPLVAIAAWLLPGSGYFLLGQVGRSLGVGITIIMLFVLGLLVAGVRVVEVPGFDVQTGRKVMYPVMGQRIDPKTGEARLYRISESWILGVAPLSEVRDKPWSVPQVMAGPMAIIAGAVSVYSAAPDSAHPTGVVGALSHSRINEIGSLYLSVAGLLNLMAIIDSTWRASHLNERYSARKDAE